MSQTLNVIAWIATMLLIVGVPACQLTWNILTTPTEQDTMLEKMRASILVPNMD